jgi:putative redox protein
MSSQPGSTERPPIECDLVWSGDLRFSGRSADASLVLDSAGKDGPSPMQSLAFALAGCMGMDVVHYLTKARMPPTALRLSLSGRRAAGHPGRFFAVDLEINLDGQMPDEQVARAIALSREKYCSVWNSMAQDIDFNVSFTVNRGVTQ